MRKPWDGYIPAETLDHYERAGFTRPIGVGRKAALLVIDTQYMTTGEEPMPLDEAISYHPMNCGEYAWNAIPHMAALIAAFRRLGLPILYPYGEGKGVSATNHRMPGGGSASRLFEIVAQVGPQPGDIMLPKTAPSAFFATPLPQILRKLDVDTLFMTGNTTSGCIRASVIDASSWGYRVVVPHEACYDRSPISHAVNLFDMNSKYAQVLDTDEAIAAVDAMAAAARVRPE